MKNIYYKSKIIGTKSIDELDFELQESFGFDYEKHDDFIEIEEDTGEDFRYNTCEATPIPILKVLNLLEEARDKGANYIEIEHNVDHHGYDFSFLKIKKASEKEIEKFENSKKSTKEKKKQEEIKKLKARLKQLEN